MNTRGQRPFWKQWKGVAAIFGVIGLFSLICIGAGAAHLPGLIPLAFIPYLLGICWVSDRYIYGGEPTYWVLGRRRAVAWHLCYWRSVRYRDLVVVEETDDEAVAMTANRRVPLGRHTMNWRELAQQLRARAGLELASEPEDNSVDVTIPPETVAAWLGLAPGETLRVIGHPELFMGLFVGAIALMLVGQSIVHRDPGPLVGGAIAVLFGGWFASHIIRAQNSRAKEIRASGESLEIKTENGWRTIAWGAIRSVTRLSWRTYQVETTAGDIMLGPWIDKRRLLPALERAVAARAAGEVLPHMVDEALPEGAISPATRAEVDEAAISRSEI